MGQPIEPTFPKTILPGSQTFLYLYEHYKFTDNTTILVTSSNVGQALRAVCTDRTLSKARALSENKLCKDRT